MPPGGRLDLPEITLAIPEPDRRDGREPLVDVDRSTPETGNSFRLDPGRAAAPASAAAPARGRRMLPIGLLGSLGVHLAPFLLLLSWSSAPAEIAAPIPVQLVLEEPPPPPPPAPEPKRPPSGRLASEDIGEPEKPAPAAEPPVPAPVPPSEPASPPQRIAALVPPPKPTPPAKPPSAAPAIHRPEPRPHPPSRPARVPGPAATRDEYLAYLVMLTRRHIDLLPLEMIAGHRGETAIRVVVLGDGTIARLSIARGSGYPDIDARIEQMVAAVRRFPPLPQWYQGTQVEMTFRLRFPEALLVQ